MDVAELRDFYAGPLGQVVRRLLTHRIRARWRSGSGLTIIGLGFASPYIGTFRGEASNLGALMPSSQGALVWPASGPRLAGLVEEERLPLADNSVDRMLAVHCLENAERVRHVLREVWRVLAPQGRLIAIVPNRRGLWARFDTTPFGQGQPYSKSQIDALMREALLTPVDCVHALHVPPFNRPVLIRSAMAFERLGARMSPGFGGVVMIEAEKQFIAPVGKRQRTRVVLRPVTLPA